MKRKRCFVALGLSRDAINEVKRIQDLLKSKNMFIGKFTELENLHLTLKFLGEIDNDKINDVKEKLRKVRSDSFFIDFGKVGFFSRGGIRIIWIRLLGRVSDLQKDIDDKLKDLFKPEDRFMGHVTIARVKHVHNEKEFIKYLTSLKCRKLKFMAENFYLMESELKPEGPIYKEIKKYNLES